MRNKLMVVFLILLILLGVSACDNTEEKEETKAHVHTFEDATCTAPKMCSCGETVGEPLGHDASAATCEEPGICNRCGNKVEDALGHSYKPANCNLPKTCSRCGVTEGEALGHTYEEATCVKPKTCSYCKGTDGEPLGHDYINDVCSRCKEKDPLSIPVDLDKLVCIDSRQYSCLDTITDSYDDIYGKCHYFTADYYTENEKAYAIFNLNGEYESISCDIVANDEMVSEAVARIEFYVDDELVYYIQDYTRVTGKTSVKIDTTGGKKLTIKLSETGDSTWTWAKIGLVNAQLKKAKLEE